MKPDNVSKTGIVGNIPHLKTLVQMVSKHDNSCTESESCLSIKLARPIRAEASVDWEYQQILRKSGIWEADNASAAMWQLHEVSHEG